MAESSEKQCLKNIVKVCEQKKESEQKFCVIPNAQTWNNGFQKQEVRLWLNIRRHFLWVNNLTQRFISQKQWAFY